MLPIFFRNGSISSIIAEVCVSCTQVLGDKHIIVSLLRSTYTCTREQYGMYVVLIGYMMEYMSFNSSTLWNICRFTRVHYELVFMYLSILLSTSTNIRVQYKTLILLLNFIIYIIIVLFVRHFKCKSIKSMYMCLYLSTCYEYSVPSRIFSFRITITNQLLYSYIQLLIINHL